MTDSIGPCLSTSQCEITLLLYNVEVGCAILPLPDTRDETDPEFSPVRVISIARLESWGPTLAAFTEFPSLQGAAPVPEFTFENDQRPGLHLQRLSASLRSPHEPSKNPTSSGGLAPK